MALPTQAELVAIDKISGNTASAPLTADQQAIVTLGQSQSIPAKIITDQTTSVTTGTIPVYNASQVNNSATATNNTGLTTEKITATQQAGVGAANDDKGTVTSGTYVPSQTTSSSQISPAPNALDQYASYTYSLSWYLLTPEQQKAFTENAKLNTNEWSLLMQSGGAPIKERNKYFMLDFYMDNLEIETSYVDGTIATATSINFTITEPNGITLIAALNKSIRDLYKQPTGSVQNAFYVMVIRFYGWDANGNMITKSSQPTGTPDLNNTNAAVVKFLPFTINKLTFVAASKAVEYRVEGTPAEIKYAMGTALGSVPHPIELVGETVDDILNGKVIDVKAKDDSKRQTTNNPPANSKVGLTTSILTGGSYNTETGAVTYATGA